MTIEPEILPETLMAYADGALDAVTAKRVERAIAEDPALAVQVERHRALNARLRDAFAPVAKAPIPAAIETMLRAEAKVVPLPVRQTRTTPLPWIGAVAASLVVGLFVGQALPRLGTDTGIALEGDRMIARGDIAHALDGQLASTQPGDAPVRIGVTFRDTEGALCRTFERRSNGGIACSSGREWRIARLYGGTTSQPGAYRQAGSATAAMMADAQAMMKGEPLSADEERQALSARRD